MPVKRKLKTGRKSKRKKNILRIAFYIYLRLQNSVKV